jgi:hypothetical protein
MSDKARDKILHAAVPEEQVEMLGSTVTVKGMTVKEQAEFLTRVSDKSGDIIRDRFTAELLISTCWDGDAKLFDPADRDTINNLAANTLRPLLEAANRVSGFTASVEESGKG